MSVSYGPNLGKIINALTGDTFDVDFRSLLRMIDALLQPGVISKALAAPPGSPANGDRYIVAASPTGAWSGHANAIAVWTTDNPATPGGLWEFYVPKFGWIIPNLADGLLYVYSGSAWAALSSGGSSTLAGDTDVVIASPVNLNLLTYDSATSKWKNKPAAAPSAIAGVNNQTASYVLVLGDAGFLVRMNVATANNCTVPPHSSVAFALSAVITVRQVGAGITTIVAGAGVTINSPATLAIARQNGTVQLVQVATDVWDLMGDVT
jgi:hypothetical protein